MTARLWVEERLATLIELRENDRLTHPEIAERMGATKPQVDQQVYKLILDDRLRRRAGLVEHERTWDDVRKELKPLYEAGELDHDEMAARLKLSRSQLQSPAQPDVPPKTTDPAQTRPAAR
jgi:hypothetical protein